MNNELQLKETIRITIDKFLLNNDIDILDIPNILKEIAKLYEKSIKKEIKNN